MTTQKINLKINQYSDISKQATLYFYHVKSVFMMELDKVHHAIMTDFMTITIRSVTTLLQTVFNYLIVVDFSLKVMIHLYFILAAQKFL